MNTQFDPMLTDQAVLTELGFRLAAARLAQNKTQATLATEAGISKRTVERLENGSHATEIRAVIRVLRVLGLLPGLDALLPAPLVSPIAQLRLADKRRQRARATESTQKNGPATGATSISATQSFAESVMQPQADRPPAIPGSVTPKKWQWKSP